jgi:A/G-specific adenine glycosylase
MTQDEKVFLQTVWKYYKKHGRHDLPWRKTTNPYRIVVSEIMLQQTQVLRVIPKYKAFLKQFPTVQALARAPLRDVLVEWQGLGYNRRAKFLHEAATEVVKKHNGKMPTDTQTLQTLPGIGPYTAGAVSVFSSNIPVVLIETNIRTVYLHHFFSHKKEVSDKEVLQLVETTLDTKNPREWYWALMDYGAYLKASGVRTNTQSKHYNKQSRFKGSDREVRGAILRVLTEKKHATVSTLTKETGMKKERIEKQLQKLEAEQMIQKQNNTTSYTLPSQ